MASFSDDVLSIFILLHFDLTILDSLGDTHFSLNESKNFLVSIEKSISSLMVLLSNRKKLPKNFNPHLFRLQTVLKQNLS